MTMKVYGHPFSPGTRLVLMALAEKNVEHEVVTLDFAKGDHKSSANLVRQPFGKMPSIAHDGLTLFESRAIARYVCEAFPGGSLVPNDPKQRALVDQWMNVEYGEFYPVAHPLALELVVKPAMGLGDPDPAKVEGYRTALGPVFAVLERVLEGKSHLVGEQFSLADMVFIPDLELLHVGGEGVRIAKFSNVSRWWKTISARPSWIRAKGEKA
jgi:glutathione S-transferase